MPAHPTPTLTTPEDALKQRRQTLTDPGFEHASMTVEDAILTRRSIRAFSGRPVPKGALRRILEVARYAPSGSNIQPWRVHALTGKSLTAYTDAMLAAARAGEPAEMQYHYYAVEWREPYLTRRRACGFGLYGAMGIARDDKAGRQEAFERNYRFFDAPAGMLFWIPSDLEHGSWLDYGTFVQSISLTARSLGLSTIAQGALGEYPHVGHAMFGIGDDYTLIGGMSVGWPAPDARVNLFQPERIDVDEFTTWLE